jgi:hypothetical protein
MRVGQTKRVKDRVMKLYLRYINPVVSLLVLIICAYAAVTWEGDVDVLLPWKYGSFPAFFLAKGLFCSSALFILGKILERLLEHDK